MNKKYTIRNMRQDELHIAIDWARQEGWNPGIQDHETFYYADPNGFFIGELDGEVIAVGSAICYDEHFGFCGLYIVKPEYRGQGYGIQITRHRLGYIGNRNAGIDGVIQNIKIYERIGYKTAYRNYRYTGIANSNTVTANDHIKTYQQGSLFEAVKKLDQHVFPASRSSFLQAWLNQKDAKVLVYVQDNTLLGYAVRRPCFTGFKIGPLFASNAEIAHALLTHLQDDIDGQEISIDIPEVNPQAMELVKRYQMTLVFETARMYLKETPKLDYKQIYGITTFELG